VRTLVISDLHLGAHTGRDLLRRADPLAALVEAVRGHDRVVLLGDTIELRHGPARDALQAADPVLRALGEAAREVVIVPGNHDHDLAAAWLAARGTEAQPPPLQLENAVSHGVLIDKVSAALSPASVRVAYPGVWLRDDVYAMHGHYADRHTTVPMFERLGAGAMARIAHEPAGGPRSVDDYEAVLAPLYAWMHALARHGGPDFGESSHGASAGVYGALSDGGGDGSALRTGVRRVRRATLGAGFQVAVAAINRAGIGPVRADISGPGLRRAALQAVGEVVQRLGIEAAHVIFGHTHRAGPLAQDARWEWQAPAGVRLYNTGCWVHEPAFVENKLGPEQPYWPGRAVAIKESGPPQLLSLLAN
jgi:UDP-2,3-diacylglucosamine pyrophosphatase LpxH